MYWIVLNVDSERLMRLFEHIKISRMSDATIPTEDKFGPKF